MQSAGFFCAALTVDAAFSVGQSILGCSYSTSSVALTAMLAFTVLEIYFLGRTVYSVFGESVDGTFYIWLCIVVIFIGCCPPRLWISTSATFWRMSPAS